MARPYHDLTARYSRGGQDQENSRQSKSSDTEETCGESSESGKSLRFTHSSLHTLTIAAAIGSPISPNRSDADG